MSAETKPTPAMNQTDRPDGTIEIISALTGRRMIIPAHAVETARALGHFGDAR